MGIEMLKMTHSSQWFRDTTVVVVVVVVVVGREQKEVGRAEFPAHEDF